MDVSKGQGVREIATLRRWERQRIASGLVGCTVGQGRDDSSEKCPAKHFLRSRLTCGRWRRTAMERMDGCNVGNSELKRAVERQD